MTMSVKPPHNISVATPRQLQVHKFAEARASELKALHSVVASRLDNDFRSRRNKRRRTNCFDNRVARGRFRKKRKVEGLGNDDEEEKEKAPRHVRRRTELKQNPVAGFSSSGDGTKRLRTHVWHAKRFKMTKLWGVHLPLHLQGSGRGSRAILKKLNHGVLVHDASYYNAVQLEGQQDVLLTILNSLLVPCQSSNSETTSKIICGLIYRDAMLHCGGSTNSRIIAPVTYMWQPEPNCNNQEMAEKNALCRKVWVWLHPAAFTEGYDALKHACETQKNLNGQSVTCISLEGHLAKIELIGSHTFELLQTILHPATRPEKSGALNDCSVDEFDAGTSEGTPFLGIEDEIISSTILTVTVKDPRMSSKEATDVCEAKNSRSFDHKQDNLCKNVNIWDANMGICPPEEETLLCHERNCQRMQSYRIFDKTSSKRNASDKRQCSRLCPIMLLKNHVNRGSRKGWSIILPLSWIRAFWIPLVSHGGHAVGLREKHWIACDVELPNFPSDFPDCNAYSSFMALKASISDEEEGLRPPSVRPLRVPVAPPWGCVRLAFGTTKSDDAQNHSADIGTSRDESSMKLLNTEISNITTVESHGSIIGGFVARTSNSLNNFLNNINGTKLLIFPKVTDAKKCLSKCMRDEKTLEQLPIGSVSQISSSQRLCFVRVRLHAYKEGALEEGAVVCAPGASDILSWSIRSCEESKVQMPQSSLRSCFVQQPSGEWELEIPRDALSIESFRWPIGFVTSGFVRGSKKPAAIALCEATLLARLREEQWRAVRVRQRRREIYVLVRNLRSTAYRLALASIILEEQEEDVEYM